MLVFSATRFHVFGRKNSKVNMLKQRTIIPITMNPVTTPPPAKAHVAALTRQTNAPTPASVMPGRRTNSATNSNRPSRIRRVIQSVIRSRFSF